eukprot:2127067-Pyramimonas_sp.AAC.1
MVLVLNAEKGLVWQARPSAPTGSGRQAPSVRPLAIGSGGQTSLTGATASRRLPSATAGAVSASRPAAPP